MGDWNLGEIYGATAADAFNVDAGPTVNTPTTLADNKLIANIAVRPSPMAELIVIQIVNVPITESV
jgi:phage tail sheath protein FI